MKKKKILAMMMALSVAASGMPVTSLAAETTDEVSFVFSNDEIVVNKNATGFEITDTTLKITESGSYRISGSCSNGNIVVKKRLQV
ncbi:MAG: hypothetical protein IJA36_13305 [Lachnospiraceae bacterium]|nr:hypothetical protein [Lachnospiraceae bacterium]